MITLEYACMCIYMCVCVCVRMRACFDLIMLNGFILVETNEEKSTNKTVEMKCNNMTRHIIIVIIIYCIQ